MQTPDKICQRAFLVGHIFLLFYFSNLKRLIVKRFRSYALEALRVKIFANGNTVETIVPQAAIQTVGRHKNMPAYSISPFFLLTPTFDKEPAKNS